MANEFAISIVPEIDEIGVDVVETWREREREREEEEELRREMLERTLTAVKHESSQRLCLLKR